MPCPLIDQAGALSSAATGAAVTAVSETAGSAVDGAVWPFGAHLPGATREIMHASLWVWNAQRLRGFLGQRYRDRVEETPPPCEVSSARRSMTGPAEAARPAAASGRSRGPSPPGPCTPPSHPSPPLG